MQSNSNIYSGGGGEFGVCICNIVFANSSKQPPQYHHHYTTITISVWKPGVASRCNSSRLVLVDRDGLWWLFFASELKVMSSFVALSKWFDAHWLCIESWKPVIKCFNHRCISDYKRMTAHVITISYFSPYISTSVLKFHHPKYPHTFKETYSSPVSSYHSQYSITFYHFAVAVQKQSIFLLIIVFQRLVFPIALE